MITNEIRPNKYDVHYGYESFDSFNFSHVRILDVETGRFHSLEQCFNLPSVLVGGDSLARVIETYENLKFRLSIGVLESCPDKVDIPTLHQIEFVIEKLFPQSDSAEQMPCIDFLSRFRIDNLEVLTDTYVIAYPLVVEPLNPFFADKFPVCDKAIYAAVTEKINEPLHKEFALLPIGVAPFRKKFEKQRERNSSVSYAEHEDVDVRFPEFPVGTIHGKRDFVSCWQEAEIAPVWPKAFPSTADVRL